MPNWRVIKRCEDHTISYTIEDVHKEFERDYLYPIARHEPPYPTASSLEELRTQYQKLIVDWHHALEQPVLVLREHHATLMEE